MKNQDRKSTFQNTRGLLMTGILAGWLWTPIALPA